jgi:prenyltransferase beta subunit
MSLEVQTRTSNPSSIRVIRFAPDSPRDPRATRRAVRGRIGTAVGHGIAHLARHFTPSGRFLGGCAGRPLETALTLHLLRKLSRFPLEQARMEDFCRRSLVGSAGPSGVKSARDVDALIARLAAERAAGLDPGPETRAAFDRALCAFDHPTRRRKAIVFKTIFAELGLTAPPDEVPALEHVHAPEHHLGAQCMLMAVRILCAVRNGRGAEIGQQEIGFLLRHQSPDGSWQSHLLLTAMATLALVAAGRGQAAAERGIHALITHIRPDGGVPFITDQDSWMTCLAGYVMAHAGARTLAAPAARYLADHQNPDGGFSYADSVIQSDADDTALSMMCLHAIDPAGFSIAIDRGADFLLGLSSADGGVPTFVPGAAADVEITAKALRALQIAGRLAPAQIERSIAWLVAQQDQEGAFRAEWKICPTYPIFHVLSALDDVGAVSPAAEHLRARALGYLLRTQRADGGWGMLPGDESSHATSTAYAVAALSHAGRGELNALRDGAAFLMANQQRDGSFIAAPDSLGPRPVIYDVPALPTVYAVWALAEAQRTLAARSGDMQPATKAPMQQFLEVA